MSFLRKRRRRRLQFSSGTKRKAPQLYGSSKRNSSHPTKGGICALTNATIYYSTTLDTSTSYLHAGVDSAFFSSHKSSQAMKSTGYECNYSAAKKAEGESTPHCTPFQQQMVSYLLTSSSTTLDSPLGVMYVQLNAGGLCPLGCNT